MNYRLLLVGQFVYPEATSAKFFSTELLRRFQALGRDVIPHDFDNTDFPDADVVLIHGYCGVPALLAFPAYKPRVKYSATFMEVPLPIEADHYFFYDGRAHGRTDRSTMINAPVVQGYYRAAAKTPGSILLDHDSKCPEAHYNWNQIIWAELAKHRDQLPDIHQLARWGTPHPDFISLLPVLPHLEYLEQTAEFETFVCTHAGSYNHTVVDMAARGMRVIVPRTITTFVPPSLVDLFDMVVCDDVESIVEECLLPARQPDWKMDRTTDLDEVVRMMDAKFCEALAAYV